MNLDKAISQLYDDVSAIPKDQGAQFISIETAEQFNLILAEAKQHYSSDTMIKTIQNVMGGHTRFRDFHLTVGQLKSAIFSNKP